NDSHGGWRGGNRPLFAIERRRRDGGGFRAYRASQGIVTRPRERAPCALPRFASAHRAVRAVAAGPRRRFHLRRVGLRLAGDGTPDGRRDRRARLPVGDGRRRGVRGARDLREPRGRHRASAGRSETPRVMARALRAVRTLPGTATTLLALLVLAALFVPALSHQDPIGIGDVLRLRLLPPFSRDAFGNFHLLGTPRFGRDLFVRMMLAGRISLAVGIVGSVVASGVGTVAGAAAAWMGGVVDRTLMGLSDVLLALPRLVLL